MAEVDWLVWTQVLALLEDPTLIEAISTLVNPSPA
jgi:hypothetical protein